MEWVASSLHTTSEHGVSSITTADAHTLAASSRLNWRPLADLNGLVRFARKTKSGFCACAITFQLASATDTRHWRSRHVTARTNEPFQDEKKWKYFSFPMTNNPIPPISERALLFGRFPGFDRLSFWYGSHVDDDEFGTLVEWYWQGKTEELWETSYSATLSTTSLTWTGMGQHANEDQTFTYSQHTLSRL